MKLASVVAVCLGVILFAVSLFFSGGTGISESLLEEQQTLSEGYRAAREGAAATGSAQAVKDLEEKKAQLDVLAAQAKEKQASQEFLRSILKYSGITCLVAGIGLFMVAKQME